MINAKILKNKPIKYGVVRSSLIVASMSPTKFILRKMINMKIGSRKPNNRLLKRFSKILRGDSKLIAMNVKVIKRKVGGTSIFDINLALRRIILLFNLDHTVSISE